MGGSVRDTVSKDCEFNPGSRQLLGERNIALSFTPAEQNSLLVWGYYQNLILNY